MDLHEDHFNNKALELFKISETLNDNWKISEKDEKFLLTKKKTISIKRDQPPVIDDTGNDDPAVAKQNTCDDVISIEYHVLYHPSYQVPVLYFNAYAGKFRWFRLNVNGVPESIKIHLDFRRRLDFTRRRLDDICQEI